MLAVGDDDQSIYAFRGARVGTMADFVREFDVRHQIKLEQNYRSHSNILDAANALISHNSTRLGKNLRTDQGPGEPARLGATSWPKMLGDGACGAPLRDNQTAPRVCRPCNGLMRSQVKCSAGQELPKLLGLRPQSLKNRR